MPVLFVPCLCRSIPSARRIFAVKASSYPPGARRVETFKSDTVPSCGRFSHVLVIIRKDCSSNFAMPSTGKGKVHASNILFT